MSSGRWLMSNSAIQRARLQFAEVGEQIAQAERGVDELRVKRGEDDVRHRPNLTTFATNAKAEMSLRFVCQNRLRQRASMMDEGGKPPNDKSRATLGLRQGELAGNQSGGS